MADIDDNVQVKPVITEATWGFLFLRLWIGFRMFFAGAQKFYAPVLDEEGNPVPDEWSFEWANYLRTAKDNVHAVIDKHAFFPLNPQKFSETFFGSKPNPDSWLAKIDPGLWFAFALPWLLLVFGFFLIIGLLPRTSLFVAGLTFMLLSIGMMALPDDDGLAYLGIHVGLVAVAMCLVRHSRFNLSRY